MYLKHIPPIIKPLARDLVFDLPNDDRAVFLTFDDGPHPEITPRVLDLLDAHEARATFFVIGERAERFSEIVEDIRRRGHTVGLHGYRHLSGWKTADRLYFEDVRKAARVVDSKLFRPPYGEITRGQARRLKKEFQLIMWSDLSADFDARYSAEQCLHFATNKVKPGSIVVFHDSEKAWPRLEAALPMCLEFFRENGFVMQAIPDMA